MLKPYILPDKENRDITEDYRRNLPEAAVFYGGHYAGESSYQEAAARAAGQNIGHRQKLCRLLSDYNRELNCGEAAIAQIEKLADPGAVAVLCGQQAGLLTGPLYTVYKAIAVVKLAAELERRLRRPVAPVFWVAAEDHDLFEVNHTYVPYQDQPKRLQLDLPYTGQPVGRADFGKEAGREALRVFAELMPVTEFGPQIMRWLEESLVSSADLSGWFAGIMARLFEEQGLVFFDPLAPAARELISPVLCRAITRREKINEVLTARETALTERGYLPQVKREEDATLLMSMAGKRQALYFRDDSYTTRDGLRLFSEEELLAAAADRPRDLGPNVLLRPVVQDTLFPTVAFVAGPGETAYFAQALALYPLFDLNPPVILPRPSLTVVEPRLFRYIKHYGIPEAMLLTNLKDFLQDALRRQNDADPEELFAPIRLLLQSEYDRLKMELAALNPQLAELTEKNLQHVYAQLHYLQVKAAAEFRKKNEGIYRHFFAMENHLLPMGKMQERVYGVLPYLIKYGQGFWRQLVEEFPIQPGHYLFYPD